MFLKVTNLFQNELPLNVSATVGNVGENDVQHQVNSCTPFYFFFLAGLTNLSFSRPLSLQGKSRREPWERGCEMTFSLPSPLSLLKLPNKRVTVSNGNLQHYARIMVVP